MKRLAMKNYFCTTINKIQSFLIENVCLYYVSSAHICNYIYVESLCML